MTNRRSHRLSRGAADLIARLRAVGARVPRRHRRVHPRLTRLGLEENVVRVPKHEGDDDGVYELTGGTGRGATWPRRVQNYGTKVDVYSWAIARLETASAGPRSLSSPRLTARFPSQAWETWSRGLATTSKRAARRPRRRAAQGADGTERGRTMVVGLALRPARQMHGRSHRRHVLTRLANDTGPDLLADGKAQKYSLAHLGGTKRLGLRSKSKSPKFGADRKLLPQRRPTRNHTLSLTTVTTSCAHVGSRCM